jgi:hypothetical protein
MLHCSVAQNELCFSNKPMGKFLEIRIACEVRVGLGATSASGVLVIES